MKFGMRTPSIKKSIKARTTGKAKRTVKSAINPMYGKKGTGFIKDPKKSIENSMYHKTTFGVSNIVSTTTSRSKSSNKVDKKDSYNYDDFIKSNQPLSATKIGLRICTRSLSLFFTGVRKKKKYSKTSTKKTYKPNTRNKKNIKTQNTDVTPRYNGFL